MPKHIVKIDNFYLEWSTIVDAPITFGMPLEEFQDYYKDEYGVSGLKELPDRLKRVEKKGTSAHDEGSAESLLSYNRAGPKETCLTFSQIKEAFLDRIPIVVNKHKWDPVNGAWFPL